MQALAESKIEVWKHSFKINSLSLQSTIQSSNKVIGGEIEVEVKTV
jgi:hypothetical protein